MLKSEQEARKAHRLDLLLRLRRAREELGRWPAADEWKGADALLRSRRSYVRHFGTWQRAERPIDSDRA